MKQFRVLATGLALLVFWSFASARDSSKSFGLQEPKEEAQELFRQLWQEKSDSDIVVLKVKYPPRFGDSPHEHPGYTFVYVIKGEMLSQLNNEPSRVYKTGKMWLEHPHDRHIINRNASTRYSAEILVFFVVRHGDELTVNLPQSRQ